MGPSRVLKHPVAPAPQGEIGLRSLRSDRKVARGANCDEYAPFIAEAAKQKADLVVLGETVPSVKTGKKPHEVAEPIPGPTTEAFGALARKHDTHIVLSLFGAGKTPGVQHRRAPRPDGKLIGKYRKVCLPHAEVEAGISPGKDYPVFPTRFGNVGLMVCYDGFFPEVARELSNRGAEVIAWPVWGCDPLVAKSPRRGEPRVRREQHLHGRRRDGWMLSAVFDPTGKVLAKGETWGTVAVAEVDLSRLLVGPRNLGDFRSMIARHRPASPAEPTPTRSQPAAADNPVFIDCGFENASPVWYEPGRGRRGVLTARMYDHERTGGNRAAGHVHFAVEAKVGSNVTLEFKNLNNIYNGRPGSVAWEMKALVISTDGKEWTPVETRSLPGDRVRLDLKMTGPRVYVARVEPCTAFRTSTAGSRR